MNKIITVSLAMAAMALQAPAWAVEPDAEFKGSEWSGEGIWCISPNGEWMASEMSAENCFAIRNLKTGKAWGYIFDQTDFGDMWDLPLTTGAANDGTIVGEYNNIPSYWRNGQWTHLKGYIRDSYGTVYATVGAITPDGSMIVGSMSKGQNIYEEEGDIQMTYPCVWYRQDDGTYGDPVWLPNPGKDYFGVVPQYLNLTGVSEDGKTISALMRSGMGFHHFPFVYRQGEDGEWSCSLLGGELINPRGREVPEYPGEYYGPSYPNYEEYMTPAELMAFYSAGSDWIDSLYEQGITDENTIALMELSYAMEFMSEEERANYEPLLNAFLAEYPAWYEAFEKYVAFLESLEGESAYFMYNKTFVSPDGKYVYAVATSKGGGGGYAPVRFDLESGETLEYNHSRSLVITGIGYDYTILCKDYNSNDGIAYLFLPGETRAVSFLDYWKNNAPLYNWLEENLYRQVVTGVASNGSYQLNDRWTMGRPVATPDLSLVGFAVSSEYWYPEPLDGSFVSTFIVDFNPDRFTQDSGVETVDGQQAAYATLLPGGILQTSGALESVTIYDLAGLKLMETTRPSGAVSTGLAPGVYLVKAIDAMGKTTTVKARI